MRRRDDGLEWARGSWTRLGDPTFRTAERENEGKGDKEAREARERERETEADSCQLTVVSPGVNLLVLGYSLQKGQGIVWTVGRTENPRAALQHPGAVQTRAVTATR